MNFKEITQYLIIQNEAHDSKLDKSSRHYTDLHHQSLLKIDFFIEILLKLKEFHLAIFRLLVFDAPFKNAILAMAQHPDIKVKMKCHEILEHMATYFMQYCATRSIYEIADEEAEQNADGVTYEVDIIS